MDAIVKKAELPRILVVDDQPQNRMLLCEYLSDLEIIVEEAENGTKCLELLREKPFTLVISDIQMPGLSGYDVLEEMRKDENLKDIPVVLISAIYDSEHHILKGIDSGAIDFIAKPVNIAILKSKVSNFLKLYEKQTKLDQLVQLLESTNKRLQENEKKFRKITNSANDAIIVIDSDFSIVFWNRASREIFGYVKYEILSENFFEKLISSKSQRVLQEYISTLKNEPRNDIHTAIRIDGIKKAGNEFPLELSLASFITAMGDLNFTVIIRDITQRVRMEKEALKAKELKESNKVMKEFMDSVSHELRTPMNAILGISNMLLKYNAENLTKKQLEGLQIINQSGSRLLDMINDVLDISRIESQKLTVTPEKIDIDKMLASLRSMVISLIDTKNIRFHIRRSSNVPDIIIADLKKLNQILINLLGNAIKFTPEGKITLSIHVIGDKIFFEVTDTGIGIEKEFHEVIFEKFKQIDNSSTKEFKGTGLGLNICRKLVEMMGGSIHAESQPGEGTTMIFHLPFTEDQTADKSDTSTGSESEQTEKDPGKIFYSDLPLAIIIDDNQDNSYWYSNILKENGYESFLCNNSNIGFGMIKRYLPDLVILKLEMPRIHGQFVIHEINKSEITSNIPLLVITSVQNLHLKNLKNPLIIMNEPVSENILVQNIRNIENNRKNRVVTNRLVLYEKGNNLLKILSDTDEYFNVLSVDAAKIIITRRDVKWLILDGLDHDGINYNILQWLKNEGIQPKFKITAVVKENVTDTVKDLIQAIPMVTGITLQSIIEKGSIDNL